MRAMRYILVGIGNPGTEYAATFHNAGINFVQHLAEHASWKHLKHIQYATIDNLIVGQSSTFMNESGVGVQELLHWLKAQPAELVVAHDDTDQALGMVKLVLGGGDGGHRGIRSIQEVLGTKEFWRLKLGVRPERFQGTPHIKADSFVLNKLGSEEAALLYGTGFATAEKLLTKLIANETPSGPVIIPVTGNETDESDGLASKARFSDRS